MADIDPNISVIKLNVNGINVPCESLKKSGFIKYEF